jgi:hypothetical protein
LRKLVSAEAKNIIILKDSYFHHRINKYFEKIISLPALLVRYPACFQSGLFGGSFEKKHPSRPLEVKTLGLLIKQPDWKANAQKKFNSQCGQFHEICHRSELTITWAPKIPDSWIT